MFLVLLIIERYKSYSTNNDRTFVGPRPEKGRKSKNQKKARDHHSISMTNGGLFIRRC
jgi:hypothetical protein